MSLSKEMHAADRGQAALACTTPELRPPPLSTRRSLRPHTRNRCARLRMHVIPPDSPNTAPTRPADLSLGASRRSVALHFVVTAWRPMRQLPDMLPPCAWAAGTLWVKT